MKTTLCRSCLFTASLLILPGCLAINAALGIAGLLGTGPIQYAGTAYSLGEYAYHYTVRGKTPDEVIEEKLAELMPDDPEPSGHAPVVLTAALDNSKTLPSPLRSTDRAASAAGEARPTAKVRPGENPRIVVASLTKTTSRPVAPLRHKTIAPPSAPALAPPPADRPAHNTPLETDRLASGADLPDHEYLEYTPDPLLTRLDRLELAFAEAERVTLSRPVSGVRCVASSDDAGQTDSGISGTWSIRHPVMQPPSGPQPG